MGLGRPKEKVYPRRGKELNTPAYGQHGRANHGETTLFRKKENRPWMGQKMEGRGEGRMG